MGTRKSLGFGLLGLILGATFITLAFAQTPPPGLKGKIITSGQEINTPTKADGFIQKMRKQDRNKLRRNASGKWVIHFVAFFNRPSPIDKLGIVVLNAQKQAVAVADVSVEKGQSTLQSQITVEYTETPGKNHILQIYYPKGKKPMVLAKKQLVLIK